MIFVKTFNVWLATQHTILAGDVNIDLFTDSATKVAYNDFLMSLLILEPSKVTAILIDHIICTVDLPVIGVQQAVRLSDYCVQIADFNIVTRSPAEFQWIRPHRHCCWDIKLLGAN